MACIYISFFLFKLKGLDLGDNAVTNVHDVSDTDAKSLAALDQSKERTTTKKEVDTGEAPNMKIKKFVDSMTPRDVQTLRVSWIKDTVKI